MKKLIIAFACLSFGEVMAQDIHFSQFYDSPLNMSPALTGTDAPFRANLNYRSQWSAFGNPFQTIAGSVDMALMKNKSSISVRQKRNFPQMHFLPKHFSARVMKSSPSLRRNTQKH